MTGAADRKSAGSNPAEPETAPPLEADPGIPTEGDLKDVPPFEEFDEVDLRESLRKALRPPPGSVAPSLLGGVQKKLRTRSRGKFYGDGWSTAKSPRSTYLVTSIVMLVLMAFVLLVLIPWSGGALP